MPDLTTEPTVDIASRILVFRGQRVLLDQDLATLFGVTTKRLNQQVRRNIEKFPSDFLFQLELDEADSLRMHFATLKKGAWRT
jgi:predicted XRE-type DNA-binding protein